MISYLGNGKQTNKYKTKKNYQKWWKFKNMKSLFKLYKMFLLKLRHSLIKLILRESNKIWIKLFQFGMNQMSFTKILNKIIQNISKNSFQEYLIIFPKEKTIFLK